MKTVSSVDKIDMHFI